MSYLPLARKYRPMKFQDLVGQESLTKTLSTAIKIGREPHGVIFSGVRGIGKTTAARLYAKALNCEDLETGDPCGVCASCVAVTEGNHEDVIEIDGASNNGVDEIRSLRDSVAYVPQRSKYKVYIIDEVHMLSTSAFNALLKTLEEPPPHVVFVFATTELQKVPQTVVGRCQTFYLQKITLVAMSERIRDILSMEGIEYDDKAVSLVAREGQGSMRDALSFLDQAIAMGGGALTLEGVSLLTLNLSAAPYIEILEALVRRNAADFLRLAGKLEEQGQEFQSVCEETATVARHAFIVRDLGADHLDVAGLGLDEHEVSRLSEVGALASSFDLNRIFRTLIKCCRDMDGSTLDRFIFENYGIEWCLDPGLPSPEVLDQYLKGLGQNIPVNSTSSQGGVSTQSQPNRQGTAPQKKGVARASITDSFAEMIKADATSSDPKKLNPSHVSASPENPAPITPNLPMENQAQREFPESWRALVDAWKLKKPLQARKLEEVHPLEYGPRRILVAVDPNGMVGPALLKKDTQSKIETAFRELFGFSGSFEAIARTENPESLSDTKENGVVLADYPLGSTSGEASGGLSGSDARDSSEKKRITEAEGVERPEKNEGAGSEIFKREALSHAPLSAAAASSEAGSQSFLSGDLSGSANPANSASSGSAVSSSAAKTLPPHIEPAAFIEGASVLPDSILQEKDKELVIKRNQVIEAARSAPITEVLVDQLGVDIERIEIIREELL